MSAVGAASPREAPGTPQHAAGSEDVRRTAVIDLGSNSFRLVVFSAVAESWWRRTDEIHESVRIGAGLDAAGALQPAPMERALHTLEAYARFCAAMGLGDDEIHPVATSAIRDATNRDAFLERVHLSTGLEVRVLSREEEAWYGYVAALNSSSMGDGVVLDLGGGSLQLVRVAERAPLELGSWPLGSVRMTERFLPGSAAKKKQLRALREHVLEALDEAPWLGRGGRLVGLGGTLRNLASAAEHAAGQPSYGIQGFELTREALDALVDELAGRTPEERGQVPGIKPGRGDIVLAGAVVAQAVLEAGGFRAVETTEFGLREGVFLARHLEGVPAVPGAIAFRPDAEPGGRLPLVEDVRTASVRNLAAQHHADLTHAEHLTALVLELWDALGEHGLHPADARERELLWAAGMLHDIGAVVDYDDHHKHSRYLILSAGLAGYSPGETALVAQLARYHRKGNPGPGEFASILGKRELAMLDRGSALLRIGEQLERARDQVVVGVDVEVTGDEVVLALRTRGDAHVVGWAAQRETELFARVFGRPLRVAG